MEAHRTEHTKLAALVWNAEPRQRGRWALPDAKYDMIAGRQRRGMEGCANGIDHLLWDGRCGKVYVTR